MANLWCTNVLIICFASFVYFIFFYNIICINLYLEYFLHNFCQNDAQKNIPHLDDLCGLLCNGSYNLIVNCHTKHLNKPVIFTGETLDSAMKMRFVMKAIVEIEDEDDLWTFSDENGRAQIPNEDILKDYLRKHIELSLGFEYNAGFTILEKIMPPNGISSLDDYMQFLKFIDDHEFLMALIFEEFRLFPKIIGTCGNLYGVEFATPALLASSFPSPYHFSMLDRDKISTAIDLIEYVIKLNTPQVGRFQLCDVKFEHFGRSSSGEILFLDLDSVETHSSLNNIMMNTKNCSSDLDCDYFDCKSKCSNDGQCSPRINTNLQILCSKIFLGNSASYLATQYGLLNCDDVSEKLSMALHTCSISDSFDVGELLAILRDELQENDFLNREKCDL